MVLFRPLLLGHRSEVKCDLRQSVVGRTCSKVSDNRFLRDYFFIFQSCSILMFVAVASNQA